MGNLESYLNNEVGKGLLSEEDMKNFLEMCSGSIAQDGSIVIDGKSYEMVGKPERMPMGIFRPARKLTKNLERFEGKPDEYNEYLKANSGMVLDIVENVIEYALGEDQLAQAEDGLNKMDIQEYLVFGLQVTYHFFNLRA